MMHARTTAASLALVVVLCLFSTTWAGVNNCIPDGKDPTVAIGDTAWLCVRINEQNQGVFSPVVDDYTQVALVGTNSLMPANTGYMQTNVGWVSDTNNTAPGSEFAITINPVVQDTMADFPKVYKWWDPEGNVKTFPTLTAIVFVDNGVVTDVAWDEGCYFCDNLDDTVCLPNSWISNTSTILQNDDYKACSQTTSQCTGGSCDLKFYIVWTGTDRHGNFMRSAGMRFSRFRQFGVEGLFNSAKAEVEAGAVTAATIANNAEHLVA